MVGSTKSENLMDLELLLFSAVASDLGIVVETSDPESLRQQLYKLRKRDETFTCLSFVVPSTPSTLWIVKNAQT